MGIEATGVLAMTLAMTEVTPQRPLHACPIARPAKAPFLTS